MPIRIIVNMKICLFVSRVRLMVCRLSDGRVHICGVPHGHGSPSRTREDGDELWKKIGSTSLSWVAAGTHNGLMYFLNRYMFVCLFVCFKG